MARYLYADSEPFPHDYDFLATLQGFLRCASDCLVAVSEIERLKDEQRARNDDTAHALEHLDAFNGELSRAIDQMIRRGQGGKVIEEAARQIQAHGTRTIHEEKVARRGQTRARDEEGEREIESQRAVIREAVSRFFVAHHIDFSKASYRLGLEEDRYILRAVCTSPTKVEIAYRLDTDQAADFQQPRRVADLVDDGMELQVGMKKKFLRSDLTREIVRIDEYYVSGAELDPDHVEIRLRKKPDAPEDRYRLTVTERDDHSDVEIYKLKDDVADPFPAVPDDVDKVQRLCTRLRLAAADALEHRKAVDWVRIDGKNLYEHDLVALMIDRFVDLYAPIVEEISNRSASDKELSLKRELDGGRREELYLRKEELAELLAPLDETKLRLFARLEVFPTMTLEID